MTWMAEVGRAGVAATRAVLRAEAAPEAADGRTAMSPLRIKHGVMAMAERFTNEIDRCEIFEDPVN